MKPVFAPCSTAVLTWYRSALPPRPSLLTPPPVFRQRSLMLLLSAPLSTAAAAQTCRADPSRTPPALGDSPRRWRTVGLLRARPPPALPEQGAVRAHHSLSQRLKPVFMFHGFILGALQQPEEKLISIITGHEQAWGPTQPVSHRRQVPAVFSPTTAERSERQKTPQH